MYKLNWQGFSGFSLLFMFFAYTFSCSCISAKKMIYFNDLPDTIGTEYPLVMNPITPFVDPKIETNDVLSVIIQTIEQGGSSVPINTAGVPAGSEASGLIVDKNGYIELPLIGFVKVVGLTTAEAREIIKQKAKEFFKEPVVNLKFANFDVMVLGDIAKVGKVTFPSEKGSIIDLIALSGDLNITAKRKNILLIRTEGDQKKFVRFDITSSKIFQSPYYYLKQRDIVYVEPNRYKREGSDQTFIRDLGIISSVLGLISLVFIFQNIKF